ncbi:MAG: type IV toxin-antitoxin system AbiEi family antitoxin [Candidatus Paceibacterota bacterium]
MRRAVLEKALTNFERNTGYQTEWVWYGLKHTEHIDAKITFKINGKEGIERIAEIKKEIRKHHIPQLKAFATKVGPMILVAERLYPNIKILLNEAEIDWLDVAGNIHLKEKNTLIWVDHHTTTPDKKIKNRAFTKTGLKVVFLFLHDEAWLNRTYREIAEAANVALGNIKHVLDGLKEHNFIFAKNKNVLNLKNKEKLLDQWLTAFADELKPRIQKERYKFINKEAEQNWMHMELGQDVVWGGEPAADLLIHDLKPMEFILYTNKKRTELMKDYKLVPDEDGKIEVREPYWTVENEQPNVAPLLTVYTDLMETGDPRNTNIAKRIYEKAAQN